MEIGSKLIEIEDLNHHNEEKLMNLMKQVKQAGQSQNFSKKSLAKLFAAFYELCGMVKASEMAASKLDTKILVDVP